MPRKCLIRTSEFPYHVMNRSNNRDFFYIDLEILWWIAIGKLKNLSEMYGCAIHCFVLMSNHYHLVLSTPKANLSDCVLYFQREVTREANKIAGRTNHFFGGRYKWTLIGQEDYYWNAVKYVFRNPVRAGICENVEDYRFSSLNRIDGELKWAMCDFFFDRAKTVDLDLTWLNEPFLNEQELAVQKALRRREFKLPRAKSGKQVELGPARYKKGLGT